MSLQSVAVCESSFRNAPLPPKWPQEHARTHTNTPSRLHNHIYTLMRVCTQTHTHTHTIILTDSANNTGETELNTTLTDDTLTC